MADYRRFFSARFLGDHAAYTGRPGELTYFGGALYYHDGATVGGTLLSGSGSSGSTSWASVTGKPNFATVATSGSYADLLNKPAIPALPADAPGFLSSDGAGNLAWAAVGAGSPTDRLVNGSKEVVLQSNGYITLANGAQLYDYGSGAGNGYGITDSLGSTYIGYDPSDTLGALHMDSYTGGNIRIRTTTLPNTYKDWVFSSGGGLTFPDATVQTSAGISVASLKAIVAASADFADFQSRIAGL